jgi:hypothetical protein
MYAYVYILGILWIVKKALLGLILGAKDMTMNKSF